MASYDKYIGTVFKTPEEYAAEIMKKTKTGEKFTDKAAAEAFVKANPHLFDEATLAKFGVQVINRPQSTTASATTSNVQKTSAVAQQPSYIGHIQWFGSEPQYVQAIVQKYYSGEPFTDILAAKQYAKEHPEAFKGYEDVYNWLMMYVPGKPQYTWENYYSQFKPEQIAQAGVSPDSLVKQRLQDVLIEKEFYDRAKSAYQNALSQYEKAKKEYGANSSQAKEAYKSVMEWRTKLENSAYRLQNKAEIYKGTVKQVGLPYPSKEEILKINPNTPEGKALIVAMFGYDPFEVRESANMPMYSLGSAPSQTVQGIPPEIQKRLDFQNQLISQFLNQPKLTWEQAMARAQETLDPLYRQQMNEALKKVEQDLIRRGFFGQLPSVPISQEVASKIEDARAAAIANLANQLVGQSEEAARWAISTALSNAQSQIGAILDALQLAYQQERGRFSDYLAQLQLMNQMEQAYRDFLLREASLTGVYKGMPTLPARMDTLSLLLEYMNLLGYPNLAGPLATIFSYFSR